MPSVHASDWKRRSATWREGLAEVYSLSRRNSKCNAHVSQHTTHTCHSTQCTRVATRNAYVVSIAHLYAPVSQLLTSCSLACLSPLLLLPAGGGSSTSRDGPPVQRADLKARSYRVRFHSFWLAGDGKWELLAIKGANDFYFLAVPYSPGVVWSGLG